MRQTSEETNGQTDRKLAEIEKAIEIAVDKGRAALDNSDRGGQLYWDGKVEGLRFALNILEA